MPEPLPQALGLDAALQLAAAGDDERDRAPHGRVGAEPQEEAARARGGAQVADVREVADDQEEELLREGEQG